MRFCSVLGFGLLLTAFSSTFKRRPFLATLGKNLSVFNTFYIQELHLQRKPSCRASFNSSYLAFRWGGKYCPSNWDSLSGLSLVSDQVCAFVPDDSQPWLHFRTTYQGLTPGSLRLRLGICVSPPRQPLSSWNLPHPHPCLSPLWESAQTLSSLRSLPRATRWSTRAISLDPPEHSVWTLWLDIVYITVALPHPPFHLCITNACQKNANLLVWNQSVHQ